MNSKLTFASAMVVVALGFAALPVEVQGQPAKARPRGAQHSAPQAAPALRRGTVRQAAPRTVESRPPSNPQATSRGREVRQNARPQAMPRGNGTGQAVQRAVPRPSNQYPAQRYRNDGHYGYVQPRGGYGAYGSHVYVRPYGYAPYRPYYFSRPYYSFRPHWNIGFGLWLGYPVPYPWAYFGGYVPHVYGYYNVLPSVQTYGGLSFDIQPADADLYVDGQYVGTVGTFTPYGEPLTLVAGVHHVAIVRDGFRTMEFDVTIQPGQVIPYRGTLQPW